MDLCLLLGLPHFVVVSFRLLLARFNCVNTGAEESKPKVLLKSGWHSGFEAELCRRRLIYT